MWILDCFHWKGHWTSGSLYSSVRMGKKCYPRAAGSEQVTTSGEMVKSTLAFYLQPRWPYRQEGSGSVLPPWQGAVLAAGHASGGD